MKFSLFSKNSFKLSLFNFSFVSVNLELINYLWIPNIFIYNLKTFQTIEVLSKLAGLWIDAQKRIYYSQATHIPFICEQFEENFQFTQCYYCRSNGIWFISFGHSDLQVSGKKNCSAQNTPTRKEYFYVTIQ